MKLSYNWLREYIDLPDDPKRIADLITAHVAEVEHVVAQAEQFKQIVVGKIIEVKPHPNADKLRLCMVELGDAVEQIVCGGSNLTVGQYVVVAKPGAQVRWHGQGDLVTLTETTIRGQRSYGMICAAVELGLEERFPAVGEKEIIDLGATTQSTNIALAQILELTDTIIEIDNKTLTHRPDLFCHIGFARELSVVLGIPLKLNALRAFEPAERLPLTVQVDATEHCRRYIGVALDHVTVQPSPDWLQQRLTAIGLRPINNVVDITNYVMYEYGQPLHAFDYDQLNNHAIVVRLAKPTETITTLDGKTHTLTDNMLVIADDTTPQALAGIMGGASSEITAATKQIVIESANFNPITVRLEAQALAIRTDGSTRHEKNLPLVFPEWGMWRAIELLEQLAGAQVASPIIDQRLGEQPRPTITLELAYAQRLMGTPVPVDRVVEILTQLGCADTGTDTMQVIPPLHRSDLLIAEELIEEIARIYGYTNIAPQPLVAMLEPQPIEPTWKLAQQLVAKAIQAGAYEVYNYSFYRLATTPHTGMLNPMNPDQTWLRQSLRTNLVALAERNLERGERDFTLVEYGHVYLTNGERNHLAVSCAGSTAAVFRQAKGFCTLFQAPGVVSIDQVGKWYVATAEFDLTALAQQAEQNLKVVPPATFPGIELDISVEFPSATPWAQIEPVIQQAAGKLLTGLDVFDIYGNALGIRMHLQAPDRTLAMDEAEQLRHTVITALQEHFKATHRY